jgi:hypothetical protein
MPGHDEGRIHRGLLVREAVNGKAARLDYLVAPGETWPTAGEYAGASKGKRHDSYYQT